MQKLRSDEKPRSAAQTLLFDLLRAENLAARLEATAPRTCARHGGALALVARYGEPTGVGFWTLEFGNAEADAIILEMTAEHGEMSRGNRG